jgi:hypothetical protein
MATFILGMNAKIYQGAAGAALGALTEMGNVRDVTLTLEAGEADITTRANSGWRATGPTPYKDRNMTRPVRKFIA